MKSVFLKTFAVIIILSSMLTMSSCFSRNDILPEDERDIAWQDDYDKYELNNYETVIWNELAVSPLLDAVLSEIPDDKYIGIFVMEAEGVIDSFVYEGKTYAEYKSQFSEMQANDPGNHIELGRLRQTIWYAETAFRPYIARENYKMLTEAGYKAYCCGIDTYFFATKSELSSLPDNIKEQCEFGLLSKSFYENTKGRSSMRLECDGEDFPFEKVEFGELPYFYKDFQTVDSFDEVVAGFELLGSHTAFEGDVILIKFIFDENYNGIYKLADINGDGYISTQLRYKYVDLNKIKAILQNDCIDRMYVTIPIFPESD